MSAENAASQDLPDLLDNRDPRDRKDPKAQADPEALLDLKEAEEKRYCFSVIELDLQKSAV